MTKRLWIAMVILAASARLLPHPWNFTPMIALGLFAGVQASKAWTSVAAVLASLVLGDAILGFDASFWYVYAAALIPVLLGRAIRERAGMGSIALAALGSSLSFFVITNFMVWLVDGIYPRTLAGLAACFVAAIPFYGNQALGDAFFTVGLFGGYAMLKRLLQPAQRPA